MGGPKTDHSASILPPERFRMETFVSAVLGDLVSRSVSFIINKCNRQQSGKEENLQRLRRVLLQVHTMVEEAEGRHITNQAMLQLLQMLREAMYRGYYLLDTVRYRIQQESSSDKVGSHYSALTTLSPAKRLCFSNRRVTMDPQSDVWKEVQKMLGSLHSIINDMAEFIIFLKFYPPISREPYNRYLFMDKCMFGRQADMEKIISFLLRPEPPGAERLQVLPILGPPRVGKSTLVEHLSYDERVRNNFSSIILCGGNFAASQGSGVFKCQAHGPHEKSLVIVELDDDLVLYERQCKMLYSSGCYMAPGSKVIVTSRSDDIVKLGTAEAIRLQYLPQEAYWYFFKVLAFGSTNPEEHPELASMAMEIAEELDRSFLGAQVICGLLRANLHTRFWRKILELQRDHVARHFVLFGEHPHRLLQKNQTAYVWSLSNISMALKVLHCQTHYLQNDVPKATLHDFQITSAKAHGKLEFLLWKSHIPPYHSYTMSCETEAQQDTMTKKKRPRPMI